MSIAATCPHCGKSYTLDDSVGGKKAKCKVCKQVFDDKVPEHIVVGTVPPFGTKHAQDNNPITINVSKGPQLVKVPDVRDMKVNDAINELRDLGFKVTVPNYNPKGHVFEQSPAPGRTVKKGSEITLFL